MYGKSSFQRNPRADLLQNGLVGSPCSPRDDETHSFRVSEWDLALSRGLCPVMELLGASRRQPSGSEGRRCKQTHQRLLASALVLCLGSSLRSPA